MPAANIDGVKTRENLEKLTEAVGGIMPVHLDCYPQFDCTLSDMLSFFYGSSNLLYQFYDAPECLHAFAKKFTDAVLTLFARAERDGWFSSVNRTYGCNPEIQAMAYNHEIANPNITETVPMKRHWFFDHAQDFAAISPQMLEEFVLRYMVPIYERFGLIAYGCCEDLTDKLPLLTRIKNMRRIAVTPWADIEKCASFLQDRYVLSWRPNPSEMVTNGFDEDRVTRIVCHAKEIFERYECHWEVNLKDFITIEHDAGRPERWVRTVRRALG